MQRSALFLLIGLFFGGGIGFVVAAANNVAPDGHHHDAAAAHGGRAAAPHEHAGEPLSLPAGEAAPSLALRVAEDPVAGWNLEVATTHFRFAPEAAGAPPRPGEGHAHLYVNGRKVARLYGPWFHLASLPKGEARLRVTLNANDHRPLAVGNRPLSAEAILQVD